jgi:dephospho-CoA kinase
MLTIGLTGGIASGKSTVSRRLMELGATVVDADAIARALQEPGRPGLEGIVEEFGPSVLTPDGRLDRAALGARVFADPEARARLDRLVHPRIVAAIAARLDRLRAEGFRGVVVLDAALLLEWGLERWCDAVIAVHAPEDEQIARLIAARGWTREDAERRLAAQRTQQDFASAADVTLDSHGPREAFEARAHAAVAALRLRPPDPRRPEPHADRR